MTHDKNKKKRHNRNQKCAYGQFWLQSHEMKAYGEEKMKKAEKSEQLKRPEGIFGKVMSKNNKATRPFRD